MKIENSRSITGQKKGEFTQFTTRYDSEASAIWCWMQPEPRPCLNTTLIDELVQFQYQLTTTYKTQHPDSIWPFRHLILASKTPGIYSLGGDLALFQHCIINKEEENLRDYAYKCISLLHRNIESSRLKLTRARSQLPRWQCLPTSVSIV